MGLCQSVGGNGGDCREISMKIFFRIILIILLFFLVPCVIIWRLFPNKNFSYDLSAKYKCDGKNEKIFYHDTNEDFKVQVELLKRNIQRYNPVLPGISDLLRYNFKIENAGLVAKGVKCDGKLIDDVKISEIKTTTNNVGSFVITDDGWSLENVTPEDLYREMSGFFNDYYSTSTRFYFINSNKISCEEFDFRGFTPKCISVNIKPDNNSYFISFIILFSAWVGLVILLKNSVVSFLLKGWKFFKD